MFCVCAAEMSHKYSVSLLEPPSQILCRNVTETQFWVPNRQTHTSSFDKLVAVLVPTIHFSADFK